MTEVLKLNENEIKILRYAKDRFVESVKEYGMDEIGKNRKLSGITRSELYQENEAGVKVVSVGRSRTWNILHDSLIQGGFLVKLEKFNNPKYFHITKKGLDYMANIGDDVKIVSKQDVEANKSSLAQFYSKKVQVICPVCKTKGMFEVPEAKVLNNDNTTTVSVPAGMVCDHHFQAFIDKNFAVRGYQKVDVDLTKEIAVKVDLVKETAPNLEGFEFPPLEPRTFSEEGVTPERFSEFVKRLYQKQQSGVFKHLEFSNQKPKTLGEIYLDFREFISDDNEVFSEFIKRDPYRKVIVRA